MATATTKRTGRDAMIRELMRDYACATEQELRMRLRAAAAWADEHNVPFGEGFGDIGGHDDAESVYVEVAGVKIEYFTAGQLASAAHLRLLEAALALFLFTNPITRRHVEEGRCVCDPE